MEASPKDDRAAGTGVDLLLAVNRKLLEKKRLLLQALRGRATTLTQSRPVPGPDVTSRSDRYHPALEPLSPDYDCYSVAQSRLAETEARLAVPKHQLATAIAGQAATAKPKSDAPPPAGTAAKLLASKQARLALLKRKRDDHANARSGDKKARLVVSDGAATATAVSHGPGRLAKAKAKLAALKQEVARAVVTATELPPPEQTGRRSVQTTAKFDPGLGQVGGRGGGGSVARGRGRWSWTTWGGRISGRGRARGRVRARGRTAGRILAAGAVSRGRSRGSSSGRSGRSGRGRPSRGGAWAVETAAANGRSAADEHRVISVAGTRFLIGAEGTSLQMLPNQAQPPDVRDAIEAGMLQLPGTVTLGEHVWELNSDRSYEHAVDRHVRKADMLLKQPMKTMLLTESRLATSKLEAAKFCLFFNKYGVCSRQGKGCPFIHDRSKVLVDRASAPVGRCSALRIEGALPKPSTNRSSLSKYNPKYESPKHLE